MRHRKNGPAAATTASTGPAKPPSTHPTASVAYPQRLNLDHPPVRSEHSYSYEGFLLLLDSALVRAETRGEWRKPAHFSNCIAKLGARLMKEVA